MLKMLEDEYDGTLGVDHAVVYKLDSLMMQAPGYTVWAIAHV